jgi:dihydrolipoamide dehydrogenase
MADYDVVVIGAGPGGYVAAIKAAQNGKKTAVIERESLGGICLNWGCIPTKALLKSAETLDTLRHAADFGLVAENVRPDFSKVMARSRSVADGMSGGIAYLMKKNKVEVIRGLASFTSPTALTVTAPDGTTRSISFGSVIIATGHKTRSFPHLPVDGERVITYRHALAMTNQPKRLLCIGAGAIGMEFGYFFNSMGTEVTVVEVVDRVLPNEDEEVSRFVERQFTKSGVKVRLNTKVDKLEVGKDSVTVHLAKDGKVETMVVDQVLVAVGFLANTDGLGLDKAGVSVDERGFIGVDEFQRTNVPGIYAIGDVAGKQLLAHKASFEAESAVGHIIGHPQPVDYRLIPGATYCQPQVASVGLTEAKAKAAGMGEVSVGRFQFMASGKAKAIGHPEGFVKLVFSGPYQQLVGAHITGVDATELLAQLCTAIKVEATARELMETVTAHPTLSEAVMEAAADALGMCVHQ